MVLYSTLTECSGGKPVVCVSIIESSKRFTVTGLVAPALMDSAEIYPHVG